MEGVAMLNKIKNNKIGGTIIEKDRDDVGGGGLFQGPDYILKYRNNSISR